MITVVWEIYSRQQYVANESGIMWSWLCCDREYLGKQIDAPDEESKDSGAVSSKGGTVSAKA